MKMEDIVILALAGVAVLMILKSGKSAASTGSGSGYTSAPITAQNPYGINGWASVPWNQDTTIPMQPGGGY